MHSSSELILNVRYTPRNTLASVHPSGEPVEGSSVTLTCSSDANPIAHRYTWYKKTGKQSSWVKSSRNYSIATVSSNQSGLYYCVAENEIGQGRSSLVQINVTYAPKHTSASVLPSGDIEEGSSQTLTCSSDANPPAHAYTWYKMLEDRSSQVGSSQNHSFVNISSEQSGLYYCVAVNVIGKRNSSAVQINVTYSPRMTSASLNLSGDIQEGDSVTLTCSSDANPPVHNYTWYRRKHGSESAWIGQGQTYSITNISAEHSGLYYCRAENKHGANTSNATCLDVHYSPRNTSASLIPSGDLHEGDSVTLNCSSDANPPVHNYTWYRKTGNETVLQGTGRMPNLTFNLVPGVDGLYHCEARNKVGLKNSTGVRVSLPDPGLPRGVLFSALGVISAVALLLVVIVCWRRQKTQSTTTSRSTHSSTQGDSDPVYDNVSTIPMVSGCKQRVPADHRDDKDDVQYTSVQFKPNKQREVPSQEEDIQYTSVQFKSNKQQEVPSQDEDVQYASVQFRKSKPEPNVPEPPLSGTSQEDTQYDSGNLQGLSAATQTGDESAIYSTVNKKSKP
ncbi:B-cell receptor CD22-like [Alosa pseudoharengus]|uniref:B-cell receptor CD22-like n=1 Tax=Alosa pseudoharengus TaxID=34774 RepID=UPI003F887F93